MSQEFHFKGITTKVSLYAIMQTVDMMDYPAKGERKSVTEVLFPKAYSRGKKLTDLADDLWRAFSAVYQSHEGKQTIEIPMQNFIDAMAVMFQNYSAYSRKGETWPTYSELERCVKETNFMEDAD